MNPAENTFDDALTGTLRQAVVQIKEQPVPKPPLQQLLDRLENWPEPHRLEQQRRRRFWAASSLAASIVFFIAWLAWPNDGWAQVVQAMQQKQWIRMTSTISGKTKTSWLSLPKGIMAWISDDATFHDSKLKVIYRYDAAEKTIYRLPEDDKSREGLQAAQSLFTSILQNKNELNGSLSDRTEVVQQERHDIISEGRKRIEYYLQCRAKAKNDLRMEMVIQVDPATHLAQKLIIKNVKPLSNDDPRELVFEIDYPDQGPLDIYDLGLAKNTKLVDRIPNKELQQIAEVIHHNRESFDSYRGIVLGSMTGGQTYPFALIWRKQTKWRIEVCKKVQFIKVPETINNTFAYWLEETKKLPWHAIEVCDGNYVYTQDEKNSLPDERSIEKFKKREYLKALGAIDMGKGAGHQFLPEIVGYPIPPIGEHCDMKIAPLTEGAPPGTTQLEVDFGSKQQLVPYIERFWIDSTRGSIVMRREFGSPSQNKTGFLSIEKISRTPSGIWYPEVIKKNSGGMYFYLDFKADLPDELFTPTERKKK